MKVSELTCNKCGQNSYQASFRGAYLTRTNPKGILPAEWQCVPSCEHKHGDQNDALMHAIHGN